MFGQRGVTAMAESNHGLYADTGEIVVSQGIRRMLRSGPIKIEHRP
jgi:hypothetical protein